jgi:hypothetical protein
MYVLKPGVKKDPVRRWALPDRVFFACGACQVLAYAWIERHPQYRAIWLKPAKGYTGNHIVAVRGEEAFDYHGPSHWSRLLAHTRRKADRWWPGWNAELVELPRDVLISEARSRQYDGLWLREPGQFLADALPRARRFVARYAGRSGPIP